LRFASGNSEATAENKAKPTQKTGPEPKQKHPPNRFAIGRSGMTTASLIKNMQNELGITAVQADMKALAWESTLA